MEFIKKKRETDPPVRDKRMRINVGGIAFETWASTLERITGTRLALLAVLGESDEAWDNERQEFFFDRHPGVFSSILHYYRTEELHTDQNLCGNIIQGVITFLICLFIGTEITQNVCPLVVTFRLNKLPSHYILDESNLNFRYVSLCALDTSREKMLNFLQTMETLIKRLIWVCTVCQLPFCGSPD